MSSSTHKAAKLIAKTVLILSIGEFPAPKSFVRALALAPKRSNGELDLRYSAGRKLEAYVAREDRRSISVTGYGWQYEPAEFVA